MEKDRIHENLSIEVNNITLSYNDVGEGDTPVILLHGYPFDKSMWKDQLNSLKFIGSINTTPYRF